MELHLVYLDDGIIYYKYAKNNISHVDEIIKVLQEAGVLLKLKNSDFFQKILESPRAHDKA